MGKKIQRQPAVASQLLTIDRVAARLADLRAWIDQCKAVSSCGQEDAGPVLHTRPA